MSDFHTDMDILERGRKAVEGFYPVPYEEVDKRLREASKRTVESTIGDLKERVAEFEAIYGRQEG